LNAEAADDLILELYTNVVSPAVTDVLSDYDLCALSGYAPLTLTPGDWTTGATGGVATATFPPHTFEFDAYAGGVTIFGFCITDGVMLLASGSYASPYEFPAIGGELTVAPQVTLRKLP